MDIVIPGGTGQIGRILTRGLCAKGHRVHIMGRNVPETSLRWDGRTDGPWFAAIDGADAVINLTGRSVSCRYHWSNLNEMMQSRLDSTLAIGRAIAAAAHPPRVWLQASTVSIYAHTLGEPHTEANGVFGGHEPNVPAYWGHSVSIARAWELALAQSDTPQTRKVAMRLGFAMSGDAGGIFDWLMWMVRTGIGGPFCGGNQYVSWIHEDDLVGAVDWLLHDESLEGSINVTAPQPLPNRQFMRQLRNAVGVRIGIPVVRGIAELGAFAIDTDVELLRKSRRVVPQRLRQAGYPFAYTTWEAAAPDLVRRLACP